MTVKTETEKLAVLEKLLSEARAEADELRARLSRCEQIITSTRTIMGHELKKPATAISGYLELAADDLEQANQLETLALVEKARAECDYLGELNEFYLELLKVDNDTEVAGKESVHVEDVVQAVVASLPEKLNAATRVKVPACETSPRIDMPSHALKLIVMNLVENALLYSQVKAPVRVLVDCEPDRRGMVERDLVKITVIDEGVGIPKEYLEKIFCPFVRLREDIADGSGLGLTLVRSLVELNGGEVFIRSEKNKGTAVHVTIPVSGKRGRTEPRR